MFLIYKPEGQSEQRWHYQPGRVHSGEMILLERETGLKYGQEFKQALMEGGTIARQGLLWLFLHRQHPSLKFADVGFYDDELVLEGDKDELAAQIEALEGMAGIPEDERQAGLAILRSQLATAPDAPGKAPAPTPAEPTPEPVPVDAPMLPPPPVPSSI